MTDLGKLLTKTVELSSFSEITLSENKNGEGTITFGALPFGLMRATMPYKQTFGRSMRGATSPTFGRIPDVASTYALIKRAQAEAIQTTALPQQ